LLQPIYATVVALVDFAYQFSRLEAENVQLRKAVKASADQVLEANKLAAEAQSENTCLRDELKKLKKKMKVDQEARHKAFIEADEKEGALRESIASLLSKFPSYLYDTSPEYLPDAMNCFSIIFYVLSTGLSTVQTSLGWTGCRMLFLLQLNPATSSKIS
jgi:hypothetical protein